MALFNETIVKIMNNFIPNETMIFDDRDSPWLHKNIQNMVNYKNVIYKKLIYHNDNHLKLHLRYFQDLLNTKTDQPKGSTLRIYLISYHTNISTLKSTGDS